MEDPFGFPSLLIRQPGKLLPSRASYEIFTSDRELLATATEAETHARIRLLDQGVPESRALAVAAADGAPLLTSVTSTRTHVTELRGADGEPAGEIRARYTHRHYTLLDDQGEAVGEAVGDLGLKQFSVTDAEGAEFAQVRKTWAGLTKEVLTRADHYTVEFAGVVPRAARLLTVMMAIAVDLTLYESA